MRKNVVLIDFENVQPDFVDALSQDHFQVLLFCGVNQTKIPLDVAAALQALGPRAQYVKVGGVGPNALDFHIAYYIGRLVAEDPTAFFHIVSRDKGFDPLILHLKSKKVLACRSESIAAIPIVKHGVKQAPAERAAAFIARLNEPKATKPRTEKTMCSAIKACFTGMEEAEAAQVLGAMVATGFIAVEAGKIVYTESAAR